MKGFWIIFLLTHFAKSYSMDPEKAQVLIIRYIEKFLSDYVVNNGNISLNCQNALTLWLKEVEQKTPWALKMVDASAKIQSGYLEGNVQNLGAFDECIAINENLKSQTILGQYCLVDIQNFQVNFTQAICLPKSCTNKDLKNIIEEFNVTVTVLDENCQTQNSLEIDSISLPVIIFFGCLALVVVASTIYDIVCEYILKIKSNILLAAFSITTNGRNLFRFGTNSRDISCIHGIRAISMIWIILGHLYRITAFYPLTNKTSTMKALYQHEFDFISGATKSVDTFLLISGVTLSYVFLTTKQKFNLFVFYIHRYLRLTPALGAVILIYIGLLKFMSSGPLWLISSTFYTNTCIEYWWKNVLYINNFDLNRCLAQTWYIAVDTQLYVISPIILILLQRKPKLGLILIGALIVCSSTTSFIITWIYNLGTNNIFMVPEQYLELYYTKPYTRASPWLIGLLLGYLICRIKNRTSKFTLNPFLTTVLWSLSFLILVSFSFYELESYPDDLFTKIRNSLYNSCSRCVWSLGVGWIIFACSFGYGGMINKLLSLPILQILSKLTYTNYLIHVAVITAIYVRLRTVPYFSNSDTFLQFWPVYVYTQFASVILAITFESPIITIEKVLFGKIGRKSEKPTSNLSCI